MINNDIVNDKFKGLLMNYIDEYQMSNEKLFDNVIKPVEYDIENIEMLEDNWRWELIQSKGIYEYPNQLKKIAIQFLTIFLKDNPQYKECDCLRIENMKHFT